MVGEVSITDSGDIERVASDHHAILTELYDRLAGTPYAANVAEVARRLLVDPSPRAKVTALAFYWSHPEAHGARCVLEIARGPRDGLVNTPDPIPIAGLNLEGRLLRTVAKLWTAGVLSDGEALDLMRSAAFRRETSRAVIPTLHERDREWLRAHADDVVASAPNAIGTLVAHLHSAFGDSIDLRALAERAVGLTTEEEAIVRKEISLGFTSPLRDDLLAIFATVPA